MNGGNSEPSLPIPPQSKLRSHDMKRSLKAARFSDFAFLRFGQVVASHFSWRVAVFLSSAFSFHPLPKILFSIVWKILADVT